MREQGAQDHIPALSDTQITSEIYKARWQYKQQNNQSGQFGKVVASYRRCFAAGCTVEVNEEDGSRTQI